MRTIIAVIAIWFGVSVAVAAGWYALCEHYRKHPRIVYPEAEGTELERWNG